MSDMTIEERIALAFADVRFQREQMHGYQDTIVEFALKHPFAALFVDMGLGKTVSSLTVISHLLSAFMAEKVLIIAPLRVAVDTWPEEIRAWQHTAWMGHTVLRVDEDDPRLYEAKQMAESFARMKGLSPEDVASAGQRAMTEEKHTIMAELARDPSSIHIINREAVEWLCYFWKDKWPYRVVFIDESHSFKDHNSKRFKALQKTRQTPGLIERLYILTGTPAAETYEHLFAQIYLLDLGERLGKNITAYRKKHFSFNPYSHKYTLRDQEEEEKILERIADITLVMKARDYLPRAEPTIVRHYVKISDALRDRMKQFERDFVLPLADGTEIEAKTAAALSSMLLQMCSGAVYETLLLGDYETEDLKKVKKVHHLHDHKIDALREIFEEAQHQGENIIVAYYFQSSLARLQKAFPKAVTMDKAGKCIKQWNKGKIPMLLIHPQSDSEGLNLQHGGSTLIFFDMIHSLGQYLQIIRRIDRQGQLKPVVIKLLTVQGSREELAADALIRKEDGQERFFAQLKRLIREHRKRMQESQLHASSDDL